MSAGVPATAVRAKAQPGSPAPFDPLGVLTPLPHSVALYPLGFPVEVATNHPPVLQAAGESWGAYPKLFDEPLFRLRVCVDCEGLHPPLRTPRYRQQGRLFVIACDEANFAVSDAERRFAACWVSAAAAERAEWFPCRFLEAAVYAALTQLYLTPLHAACVAYHGRGVLLCGPAGAGKSTLAYACLREGWTYLADESPLLVRNRDDRLVLGKPDSLKLAPEAAALFSELSCQAPEPDKDGEPAIVVRTRGLPTAFAAQADFVVLLERGNCKAHLARVGAGEALAQLLAEIPFFGEQVYSEQKQSLERLLASGAWRLHYNRPDDALRELYKLVEGST